MVFGRKTFFQQEKECLLPMLSQVYCAGQPNLVLAVSKTIPDLTLTQILTGPIDVNYNYT